MRRITFSNCYLVIFACVVQTFTAFIIPQIEKRTNKEDFRSSNHERLRRRQCEVRSFYDVKCHGMCPHLKEDWGKNKAYMNCKDGLSYHCARDNKTGEYVEACAEAVRCERGKEPRLFFPPGHNRTANVICRYCEDKKYYNPIEFMLSSEYYECQEYKYPCSLFYGQIECDEYGIERHWTKNKCRCDTSKNFIEESAVCPTDSPCKDSANLTCEKYSCGDGYKQDLKEDYCCTPVDISHDISSANMNVTHLQRNITETMTNMSVSTAETTSSTITRKLKQWNATGSSIKPKARPEPKENILSYVVATLVVIVVGLLVALIYLYCKNRERNKEELQDGQNEQEFNPLLQGDHLHNGNVPYLNINNADDRNQEECLQAGNAHNPNINNEDNRQNREYSQDEYEENPDNNARVLDHNRRLHNENIPNQNINNGEDRNQGQQDSEPHDIANQGQQDTEPHDIANHGQQDSEPHDIANQGSPENMFNTRYPDAKTFKLWAKEKEVQEMKGKLQILQKMNKLKREKKFVKEQIKAERLQRSNESMSTELKRNTTQYPKGATHDTQSAETFADVQELQEHEGAEGSVKIEMIQQGKFSNNRNESSETQKYKADVHSLRNKAPTQSVKVCVEQQGTSVHSTGKSLKSQESEVPSLPIPVKDEIHKSYYYLKYDVILQHYVGCRPVCL